VPDEKKLDGTAKGEEGVVPPIVRLRKDIAVLGDQCGISRDKLCLMFRTRYPLEVLKTEFSELDVERLINPSQPAERKQPRRSLVVASPLASVADIPAPVLPVPGELLNDSLSYLYVPLIQCSLPHSEVEATSFTRRNGRLELMIAASKPEYGLPYGVPARLLTIFFSTEVVRTKSAEVFLGRSINDFLKKLEVPITYGSRGSMTSYSDQLMRLFYTYFSIEEKLSGADGRQGLHIKQTLFSNEARFWWDDNFTPGEGSVIVLSDPIYQTMRERSAPMSTEAIKRLRKSPMDLDVYAWLVYRLWGMNRPSLVTWEQLSGQFGSSYEQISKFKKHFLESLKRVYSVYPEAKIEPLTAGLQLLPSKPHIRSSELRFKK
jgi:hypothetical protein